VNDLSHTTSIYATFRGVVTPAEKLGRSCNPSRETRESSCNLSRETREMSCNPSRETRESSCNPSRETRERSCNPSRETRGFISKGYWHNHQIPVVCQLFPCHSSSQCVYGNQYICLPTLEKIEIFTIVQSYKLTKTNTFVYQLWKK